MIRGLSIEYVEILDVRKWFEQLRLQRLLHNYYNPGCEMMKSSEKQHRALNAYFSLVQW